MNSSSTHFVASERMGFYQPIHQMGMWTESFKGNGVSDMASSSITVGNPQVAPSTIIPTDTKFKHQAESFSNMNLVPCQYDPDACRPPDKVQRRLAQNREAARKSRLRKKAYVKQLETSRLKLIQLEQDFHRAKQQGVYVGSPVDNGTTAGYVSNVSPGVAKFEKGYTHWLGEQEKLFTEIRTALNANANDAELQVFVETAKRQYSELFRLKAAAASCDVFYMLSGMWKTSVERIFLWIGGFRPSEFLKILRPQIESLTEQQYVDVGNLSQSCLQAEEALSQGMDKLQQLVANLVATGHLDGAGGNPQVETAIDKVEGLVRFALQADHLRQETLHQMTLLLTAQQAARGMLVLGDFFHRLRELSSVWANRSRDQT